MYDDLTFGDVVEATREQDGEKTDLIDVTVEREEVKVDTDNLQINGLTRPSNMVSVSLATGSVSTSGAYRVEDSDVEVENQEMIITLHSNNGVDVVVVEVEGEAKEESDAAETESALADLGVDL